MQGSLEEVEEETNTQILAFFQKYDALDGLAFQSRSNPLSGVSLGQLVCLNTLDTDRVNFINPQTTLMVFCANGRVVTFRGHDYSIYIINRMLK